MRIRCDARAATALLMIAAILACTPTQRHDALAVASALNVATCGILEVIVAPGPTHDEIGHVCSVSRPLIQGIVDMLGAPPVTGAGAGVGARRTARHPLRHRGIVVGHLRDDWAPRVQAALDAAGAQDGGVPAQDGGIGDGGIGDGGPPDGGPR